MDYRDAQAFRWVTAALAAIPFLVVGGMFLVDNGLSGAAGWAYIAWEVGSVEALLMLLLGLGPGVASYCFQMRRASIEAQNRAIALSYYAWAPAALPAPVVAVGALLAVPFVVTDWRQWGWEAVAGPLFVVSVGLVLLGGVTVELRLYGLIRRVLRHGRAGALLRLAMLNLLLLALVVVLTAVPAGVVRAGRRLGEPPGSLRRECWRRIPSWLRVRTPCLAAGAGAAGRR